MAEATLISWADSTFNPFIGCTKVSEACRNCYAANYGHRFGVEWGPGKPRRRTSEGKWREPLSWNRKAAREGTRPRVFCASLADWLDHEVPAAWLADLFALIDQTPHLDWLLLTKRPERFRERLAAAHKHETGDMECDTATSLRIEAWLDGKAWPNVWVGTTVESQEYADKRIPALLSIPARVRFLSCEPLLERVDLGPWIGRARCTDCGATGPREGGQCFEFCDDSTIVDVPNEVHWIIAGGESGAGARPSHPDWFRSLRDQAKAAGVAFHFKQWGEFAPEGLPSQRWLVDMDGKAVADPLPQGIARHGSEGTAVVYRVGKGAAGRELDGVVWDEVPEAATS